MSYGNWNDWKTWLMPGGIPAAAGKSFLNSDFGNRLMGTGEYDPAKKATPFLEEARNQYLPYQEQGQQAGNQLYPEYENMMKDPGAFYEQMMKGYQPSTAYQQKFGAMSQAAGNTAAAGGMRGSLSDIQNQAGLSQSLMGDDMQQWLQNLLGIKGAGMQGLGNFYEKGYGATSDIANTYGSQAGLNFQGQSQQNQNLVELIKALITGAGKAAGGAASSGST